MEKVLIGGPEINRAPLYSVTVFADHYPGGRYTYTDATFWQVAGQFIMISFERDRLVAIPIGKVNELYVETQKETVEIPLEYL